MSDEKEQLESEEIIENVAEESKTEAFKSVTTVTPLSKYLAMVLFILMPFVGGWIGYNYAPENVVEVEKIVMKETNEVLTGEMSMDANFFTYRNEEYGFEFRYPKTFVEYQEEYDSREMLHDDLVFKIEFQESLTEKEMKETYKNMGHPDNIFVRVFKTDLPLEEWLLKNYRRADTELEDYVIGWPIILGGEDGFYSSTGCCGNTDIAHVVKKGDFIFELGTNSRYLSGEVVQSTADAFKFFEPVAISDWQTYRNEEYGFEFEYPSDEHLYIEDESTIESKWLYVEVMPEWDALNGSGVSVSLKKSSTEIFLNSLRQYGEVKNNGTEVVNGITWDKYQYVDPEPTHSTSTYIWLTEINGYLTQVSYWDYTNPTQLLGTFKILDQ